MQFESAFHTSKGAFEPPGSPAIASNALHQHPAITDFPVQRKKRGGISGVPRSGGAAVGGLPEALQHGIESLSGLAMDDVRVHYNSREPQRMGALAYARGTNIYLGPGQERHLAHEAWHVVQQKQQRVAPTFQFMGLSLNEDQSLEHEADRMGARAEQLAASHKPTLQQKAAPEAKQATAQFMKASEGKTTEWKTIWFGMKDPDRINRKHTLRTVAHAGIYFPGTGDFIEWGAKTKNCKAHADLNGFWAYEGQSWIGDEMESGTTGLTLSEIEDASTAWATKHGDAIKKGKAQYPNNCRGYVDATVQL